MTKHSTTPGNNSSDSNSTTSTSTRAQASPKVRIGQPDRPLTMLELIGGEILELSDGHAKGILNLSPMVMQPTKVFHAGSIVVLADELASYAICGTMDTPLPKGQLFPYSIQISLNLLSNDPVGPLSAEANVVKRGRVTVVDTTITGSTGKTVALMRSSHLMVDPSTTGPHLKKKNIKIESET